SIVNNGWVKQRCPARQYGKVELESSVVSYESHSVSVRSTSPRLPLLFRLSRQHELSERRDRSATINNNSLKSPQ
ncbi:MAG: hypothetical protein ACKVRP_13165, partial [Bacteroidota bacterium]